MSSLHPVSVLIVASGALLLLASEALRSRYPQLSDALATTGIAALLTISILKPFSDRADLPVLESAVAVLAVVFAFVRLRSNRSLLGLLIGGTVSLLMVVFLGVTDPLGLALIALLITACFTGTSPGCAWSLVGLLVLTAYLTTPSSELTPPQVFGVFSLLAVLLVLGPYWAHRIATRPGAWTALAATAGVALFWIAANAPGPGLPSPWRGVAAIGCAATMLSLAVPLERRLAKDPGSESTRAALAPLLAGVAVLVSFAVALEIGIAWEAAGCALAVLAVTWLAVRTRVRSLENAAVVLALASIVALYARRAELDGPAGWIYVPGVLALVVGGAAYLTRTRSAREAQKPESGSFA